MPRVYDLGSCFRVTASEDEVRQWKQRWPCSGIRTRPHFGTFDRTNGDLVDTSITEDEDGDAASAMMSDLQTWGGIRLSLSPADHDRSDERPWGTPTAKKQAKAATTDRIREGRY